MNINGGTHCWESYCTRSPVEVRSEVANGNSRPRKAKQSKRKPHWLIIYTVTKNTLAIFFSFCSQLIFKNKLTNDTFVLGFLHTQCRNVAYLTKTGQKQNEIVSRFPLTSQCDLNLQEEMNGTRTINKSGI